ncbi:MAG: tRNA (adenosine(37)-N6)-threonylcarbamoyltransferase complex dimerization subunit type 1 TsaB [Chitinophagales bacterium]|nr:tRNA (adenosine(37)-N6)-threonylcarbamoyltransferase complex dimerization subunit type 1 TsaB [Chitinophagales bacterium]
MALILNIETSTEVCSVALAKDGTVQRIYEEDKQNHASGLSVMIERLFHDSGVLLSSLDAVAISAGPGSYTGLRIGTATAKGLCYALEKPLIAINSLHSLAANAIRECPSVSLYCPVIEARKSEIYYGLYNSDGVMIRPPDAIVITDQFLNSYIKNHKVLITGKNVSKYSPMWKHENIIFRKTTLPSASWMCTLTETWYHHKRFSDLLSFEPYYLKPAYIISSLNQ